jgi:hypothetical protein
VGWGGAGQHSAHGAAFREQRGRVPHLGMPTAAEEVNGAAQLQDGPA